MHWCSYSIKHFWLRNTKVYSCDWCIYFFVIKAICLFSFYPVTKDTFTKYQNLSLVFLYRYQFRSCLYFCSGQCFQSSLSQKLSVSQGVPFLFFFTKMTNDISTKYQYFSLVYSVFLYDSMLWRGGSFFFVIIEKYLILYIYIYITIISIHRR